MFHLEKVILSCCQSFCVEINCINVLCTNEDGPSHYGSSSPARTQTTFFSLAHLNLFSGAHLASRFLGLFSAINHETPYLANSDYKFPIESNRDE